MGLKGFMCKVLSFFNTEKNGDKVSEVTVDPGGGANISGDNFTPTGEDSQPLPGDFAIIIPISGTGVDAIVGYMDRGNDQKSQAGERRIYARNGGGVSVVELHLKNDGSALIRNDNNSITLKVNGDIELGKSSLDSLVKAVTLSPIAVHTHPVSGAVAGPSTDPAMIALPTAPGNKTQKTEAQ